MSPTIKEIDRQIREAKNAARYALTIEEKVPLIQRVKALNEARLIQRRKEIAALNSTCQD